MEELALARMDATLGDSMGVEYHEPIADVNFNRKKMFQLEQNMTSLQKAARRHNEVVSTLESGMKAMISETDLRRAIGLAFQEFEQRLEDAFQDSSRKCLSLFSRKDDVEDMQEQLNKKVNWADHNAAMKRLTDLRQYIDTMAESVFIGHREALSGEFAKKADKVAMDQALSVKADNNEVHEVRARLERLEVLVAHHDARQTKAVEALREESEAKRRELSELHMAKLNENAADIVGLKEKCADTSQRVSSSERELVTISSTLEETGKGMRSLRQQQTDTIMPKLDGVQGQLDKIETDVGTIHQDLRTVDHDAGAFRETAQRSFGELRTQVKASKEHVEFLLEELEMMKRRSQERHKKSTASVQELTEGQEALIEQLKSIERDLKKQGRDMRAIDHRASKALDDNPHSALAGLRALSAPPPPPLALGYGGPDEAGDPNDRLRAMMEQIERIAGGGPPQEHFLVPHNPDRPPLPGAGAPGAVPRLPIGGAGIDGAESTKLPRFNSGEGGSGQIETARTLGSAAAAANSAAVRGMYGLSPRIPPAGTGKVAKKKLR